MSHFNPKEYIGNYLKGLCWQPASLLLSVGVRLLSKVTTFLWSIGLGILTLTRGAEQPKVLVTRSWKVALARCGVHLLPALVSTAVITINLANLYSGPSLQGGGQDSLKLGVLQVCAKAQELLVVGSLATIIFHVIRAELASGDGIPLGLIGSGFNFTQVSFFWSSDFLGSLKYTAPSRYKKYGTLLLLVTAGGIAVLAGPATAVLMIPREIDWHIGGAQFWLNGTREDMWPTTLDSASLGPYQCLNTSSQIYDPNCPSAGYNSVYGYLDTLSTYPFDGRLSFELKDRRHRKNVQARIRHPTWAQDTWAVTAHDPSAIMLLISQSYWVSALDNIWGKAVSTRPSIMSTAMIPPNAMLAQYPDKRTFRLKTELPAVRAACMWSNTYFQDISDLRLLEFPILPPHSRLLSYSNVDWSRDVPISEGIIKAISDKIRSGSNSSTSAVPIEISMTNSSSLGLILLHKQRPVNETEEDWWEILGCSVDARWAPGTLTSSTQAFDIGYDTSVDQGLAMVDFELPADQWGWGWFAPPPDGSWRPINVKPSWFELFSPILETSDMNRQVQGEANQTLLDNILSLVAKDGIGDDNTRGLLEHAISTFVADGISRVSSHRTLKYAELLQPVASAGWTYDTARKLVRLGSPVQSFDPPPGKTLDQLSSMTMHAYIHGYVMATMGWFDCFCIAVLLLHALIALCHTAWILYRRETSDTWETISELLSLALTSSVPRGNDLANTCAGIRKWGTATTIAMVEDVSTFRENGSEQLQLRLKRDNVDTGIEPKRPQPGLKYGKNEQSIRTNIGV